MKRGGANDDNDDGDVVIVLLIINFNYFRMCVRIINNVIRLCVYYVTIVYIYMQVGLYILCMSILYIHRSTQHNLYILLYCYNYSFKC